MQNKKIRKSFLSLTLSFLLVFAIGASAYAQSIELVPLGRTTGMKFFSQGAVVVGFSEVNGRSPAEKAGLFLGDVIVKANGADIFTNEMLSQAVMSADSKKIKLEILRDGKPMSIDVPIEINKDGKSLIGAWVRDSMAGIGTITFVDPKTGAFGALGHGVSDMDTGLLMSLDRGS